MLTRARCTDPRGTAARGVPREPPGPLRHRSQRPSEGSAPPPLAIARRAARTTRPGPRPQAGGRGEMGEGKGGDPRIHAVRGPSHQRINPPTPLAKKETATPRGLPGAAQTSPLATGRAGEGAARHRQCPTMTSPARFGRARRAGHPRFVGYTPRPWCLRSSPRQEVARATS